MRILLDTNVLIALFDANHIFHSRAHQWFQKGTRDAWASCPITENGLVRIVTQAAYRTREEIAPFEIMDAFRELAKSTDHEFWPDAISIMDSSLFAPDRIHGAKQITDLYLLALAVKRAGCLATFDSKIPLNAVRGAAPTHVQVLT